MDKRILSIYKIPFFTSLTLVVVLIAINTLVSPLQILYVLLGSFIGMISLDLEYIIFAYSSEPEKDFSRTVRGFLRHGDFSNLIKYIHYNKEGLRENTVNSALFQIAFAIFSIFAISVTPSIIIKTIVLSIYANLFYRSIEAFHTKEIVNWFWAFKKKPTRQGTAAYLVLIATVFVYCLNNF
jgi:hypothetical protein